MVTPKAQYLVNAQGKPMSVLISKKEYDNLIEYRAVPITVFISNNFVSYEFF